MDAKRSQAQPQSDFRFRMRVRNLAPGEAYLAVCNLDTFMPSSSVQAGFAYEQVLYGPKSAVYIDISTTATSPHDMRPSGKFVIPSLTLASQSLAG